MDQQGQSGPMAPGGRRLHIAHRRSPSELTPLMMEQLAIAQQIEALQQQQQQIAATSQYLNMGMMHGQQIPGQQMPGQQIPNQQMPGGGFPITGQMANVSPHGNQFQFPQQMGGQHLQVPMGAPTQPGSHRRNQSSASALGPPPAPSSGASGFGEFNNNNQGERRENQNPRGGRGGNGGSGHARRHSLALPEAKKAAEIAEQKRRTTNFQFPGPAADNAAPPAPATGAGEAQTPQLAPTGSGRGRGSGHGRSQSMAVGNSKGRGGSFQFPQSGDVGDSTRRSGQHSRTGSRNFEGNWRQPNNQQPPPQEPQQSMGNFQNPNAQPFQPSHRTRGSMQSMGSLGNFQYQGQPQMLQLQQGMMPQFGMQNINPIQFAQLQALQAAQMNGQGLQASQHAPQNMPMQQQNQQQRKTLFTPYLPQASLPALLGQGQLVAGILRVNKKNRSDAYVTTQDLDADIFICGSKDRNRALEGDLVAVELLDVDEVWGQKREKEEKKKRKDHTDSRGGGIAVNDATTQPESSQSAADGGIRRRGSLKQRPTQKKNDDVEVEGQSLLLMEEEEINDEQKPLYAGHIVAVVERIAGQMFSGTLGLLRPSSQATKEKQEAERAAREGHNSRPHQQERHQDKPKIVWFKPTDKRVPLIAIPTEQAPRDFVEKHQDYANRIFVACIKRWPITSLHPFGTLVEQLGEMGDLTVETDALLRDNNFGPDNFSDAVLNNVGFENWTVSTEGRKDLRDEPVFTLEPRGCKALDNALHVKVLEDGTIELGVHIADVSHFIKASSLVDREAKKRATAVYLMNRTVNMLPPRLSSQLCCLTPGEDRYTASVIFKIDPTSGRVLEDKTWIGKAIVKSTVNVPFEDIGAILSENGDVSLDANRVNDVKLLNSIAQKLKQNRFGDVTTDIPPLRLLYQLDDENVPVEKNIFDTSAAHELVEEIHTLTNGTVARKILEAMPEKAMLRRQADPNPRRLRTFAERMNAIGVEIDITSSSTLQNSLFNIDDVDTRKGVETLLIKSMQRAKYHVAGKSTPDLKSHFSLNMGVYTHFTNPSRRYADVIVHRQLDAILSDNVDGFSEDVEALNKTADHCNTKKDSSHFAQEQSVHIEACRLMDKHSKELGGDLISEGIVLCVYESAFDVLIPEWGFEKRVHCDQLPLKKAEFDKNKRLLELFWEKGVPSSAYIPEDERPKNHSSFKRYEAPKPSKDTEEAQRKQVNTGTISTDDVDALFDDSDDESTNGVNAEMQGVSLNPVAGADRPTQSMPPSPTRNGLVAGGQTPHRTKSDSKLSKSATDTPGVKLTNKEKYLDLFTLRDENGDCVQEVRELTRVPIILKTDLSKSPPCLTIRSLNPFAL
ncbi:RNB-domain-containing protein [Eremomyces bilateralis CBS 781.70]|uniref:RNB-domain-containing protein n=1 Tax=Eremomyces bilateralis CBS 781.70 TaxID=1392243 RepID=A0A6G1G874_9PEZI|nr:RNB-domain-containing protein [Eremomyces bilateralis CBS 781.70]KAF1814234.1 RNB-domain-containing protein [Eremomyces bilateralis CBS 781.70]